MSTALLIREAGAIDDLGVLVRPGEDARSVAQSAFRPDWELDSTTWATFDVFAPTDLTEADDEDVVCIDGRHWRREPTREFSLAFNPPEPACCESGIDWQRVSVVGNGGGVIIRDRCAHCGIVRVTDTYACRPDTGEQGLTSIEYLDPETGDAA